MHAAAAGDQLICTTSVVLDVSGTRALSFAKPDTWKSDCLVVAIEYPSSGLTSGFYCRFWLWWILLASKSA